jgi:hypothetical protein
MLKNLTPFPHFQCDKMGPGRIFCDVVVVKATFELRPDVLVLAEEQADIVIADEYWDGNPSRSSLKRAGEVLLAKPGTDVILTGTARVKRPAPSWDVAVVVRGKDRTLLSHQAQASGRTRWEHRSLRGFGLTDPEPTTEVPIRYELEYGGAYTAPNGEQRLHEANPSGWGFVDERTLDRARTYPGPQWHPPSGPVPELNVEDFPLAGLGPVARPWQSRLRYAGTYDESWDRQRRADTMSGRVADYPSDFDLRFFQCAHPLLASAAHLAGDEQLGLSGLVADRTDFLTRLPGTTLSASLRNEHGWRDVPMPLDTVHVDLDRSLVYLCWRLTLDHRSNVFAAVITAEGGSRG